MKAPAIYCAHPLTREYICSSLADPDPLDESNWLIPAHAYRDEPMALEEGHAIRRSEGGSNWELVEDHRGQLFNTATGEALQFDDIGPIPEGLTDQPYPGPYHRWSGAAWTFDVEAQRLGLIASASARRDNELRLAAVRIAPLQDAVELGEASAKEESALTLWKRYRVQLNRIDQQAGYPNTIEWPVSPVVSEDN